MTDDELQTLIETRLNEAFAPELLVVTNESEKHRGHAGHRMGGRHFSVEIKADAFSQSSRVEAHRKIYALFQELMPVPIHAMRIRVL